MRQLRFVGPGEDGDHVVVETVDGAEQFSLLVTERLRDAIRSDLPQILGPRAKEASISPREIQTRVRAGESPDTLAAEADMPVQRILIFAGPVLAERTRVAGEARRARARRSTPEGQLVEFGTAVDERFAAHGIEPADVRWDAHRREDGQWVIAATWRGGDSDRTAHWAFTLAGRTVTPLDETAGDLLSDRPIRPVVQVVPDPPSAAEALTGPLPIAIDDDPLYDQDATTSASDYESTPPLPLRLAEPMPPAPPAPTAAAPPASAAGDQDEDEEHKAARARIPSWDDILLGVRRKRD